ncbi:hypothetical protein PAPYR_1759 [Paratrimastix pyriformis]|uniref:Uncharacterized protein n=1 Tax=Paratrimastix pyriformis TaxID=342808 RepID=A0ABQ8UTB8_9EUKA|nr:hypothetical protein PAPYR_1759 [Paratrimastix pyriformis]
MKQIPFGRVGGNRLLMEPCLESTCLVNSLAVPIVSKHLMAAVELYDTGDVVNVYLYDISPAAGKQLYVLTNCEHPALKASTDCKMFKAHYIGQVIDPIRGWGRFRKFALSDEGHITSDPELADTGYTISEQYWYRQGSQWTIEFEFPQALGGSGRLRSYAARTSSVVVAADRSSAEACRPTDRCLASSYVAATVDELAGLPGTPSSRWST